MSNYPANLISKQNLANLASLDEKIKTNFRGNLLKETNEGNMKSKEDSLSSSLGEYSSKKVKKESLLVEIKGAKQKFKEFHTTISSLPNIQHEIKEQYERVQKDVSFKKVQIQLPDSLLECFEKLCQKIQSNAAAQKKNWNEDETSFLISAVTYWTYMNNEDHKKISEGSWKYLASVFPGRSIDQIQQKWHNLLRFYLSKDPWTPDEDKLMRTIVISRKDLSDWKGIAQELNMKNPTRIHRSAKQCRERWNNHVNPEVNRGPWTTDQDSKLLSLILDIGKKWSQIAKEFGNRTENAVKNRWHSLMRRVGVGDSNEEMNELEEREKIKQLFKILSGGPEGDKKDGNAIERSEYISARKKTGKTKNHHTDIKSEHDDAENNQAHPKNFLKRTTGKHNAKPKKTKSEEDVKSLAEKIHTDQGKVIAVLNPLAATAGLESIFEKQLLNNLAYIAKPTIQPLASGLSIPSSTTHIKLFSETPLEPKSLQISKEILSQSSGIHPELHSRLTELAMAANGSNGESISPILQTTTVGSLPLLNNSLFFVQFPQQQPINTSQVTPEANGLKFEVKTEDVSHKEQLKRLFSELETTLLKNGNPISTQKPNPPLSQVSSTLTLRIEESKPNIADFVIPQSHKYQFSLINRENNTIILLDHVTGSNSMFIKDISKLSNPEP